MRKRNAFDVSAFATAVAMAIALVSFSAHADQEGRSVGDVILDDVQGLLSDNKSEAACARLDSLVPDSETQRRSGLFFLGLCKAGLGDDEAAANIFIFLLGLENTPRLHFEAAKSLLRIGRAEDAIFHLQVVVASRPPVQIQELVDAELAQAKLLLAAQHKEVEATIPSQFLLRGNVSFARIYDTNVNSGTSATSISLFGLPLTIDASSRAQADGGNIVQGQAYLEFAGLPNWQAQVQVATETLDHHSALNSTQGAATLLHRWLGETSVQDLAWTSFDNQVAGSTQQRGSIVRWSPTYLPDGAASRTKYTADASFGLNQYLGASSPAPYTTLSTDLRLGATHTFGTTDSENTAVSFYVGGRKERAEDPLNAFHETNASIDAVNTSSFPESWTALAGAHLVSSVGERVAFRRYQGYSETFMTTRSDRTLQTTLATRVQQGHHGVTLSILDSECKSTMVAYQNSRVQASLAYSYSY